MIFTDESHIYSCGSCGNQTKMAKRLANFDRATCRFVLNLCSCGGQLRWIGASYTGHVDFLTSQLPLRQSLLQ